MSGKSPGNSGDTSGKRPDQIWRNSDTIPEHFREYVSETIQEKVKKTVRSHGTNNMKPSNNQLFCRVPDLSDHRGSSPVGPWAVQMQRGMENGQLRSGTGQTCWGTREVHRRTGQMCRGPGQMCRSPAALCMVPRSLGHSSRQPRTEAQLFNM